MIPKQPRQVDPKYLDFVRGKKCLCDITIVDPNRCCVGYVVPHHTISRGAWGSDYRTIPICAFHHAEAETRGIGFMQDTYHFSVLDEIIKLLSEYLRGGKNVED